MSEKTINDEQFRFETNHALSILTKSVNKLTEDVGAMNKSVTEFVQTSIESNRLSNAALKRIDEQRAISKKQDKKIRALEDKLRPLETSNEKFKKLEAFLWQKIGLGLTAFAVAIFGIVYVTR